MAYTLSRDETGQIIVVLALLIAVVFVGLAVTVNSAIYAENLATRTTSETTECGGLSLPAQLEADYTELVEWRNEQTATTNYTAVAAKFETDFDAYETPVQEWCAQTGIAVATTLRGTEEGVRLRQTNESRDFTDKNGNWNWTLTTDAPRAGQFAVTIDPTALYEDDLDLTLATLASEAFHIEFTLDSYGGAGDGVWRIYFYRGSLTDNVYAVVETPEQTFADDTLTKVSGMLSQTCTAHGDTVGLRLRAGTFGGAPCSEFSFYEAIGSHDVSFANARVDPVLAPETARARGGYNILYETRNINENAFHDVGGGQPFEQSAITEMRYDATVETPDSTYRYSNATVIPLEANAGGILRYHPQIETYAVTDETNGDPSFTVNWRAFDLDGDLDRGAVYLVHVDDEKIVDSVDYLGPDSVEVQGSDTLTDTRLTAADGDEYLVVVGVVDAEGRAAMHAETYVAG